jgi:hypothetical protein
MEKWLQQIDILNAIALLAHGWNRGSNRVHLKRRCHFDAYRNSWGKNTPQGVFYPPNEILSERFNHSPQSLTQLTSLRSSHGVNSLLVERVQRINGFCFLQEPKTRHQSLRCSEQCIPVACI